MVDEIQRLRAALRDLVALATIPAAWVGSEPSRIAAGLADVLARTLLLDFVFVRLCDPSGGTPVDVTRGNTWNAFPEWLERHLVAVGPNFRKEIIPHVGGDMGSCRGLVIPIGLNAAGGLLAVACERADFPTETDQLLLSVAANHASTGFQSARLIHERRRTEEELRQARAEEALQQARRELALVARRTTLAAMAAGIAHELRQPLSAIVSNASAGLLLLAKTPPKSDEVRDTLNDIVAAGHRASDVLEAVRAIFSQTDQTRSAVDVNELIRESVALARAETEATGTVVRLQLASQLPLISAHRVQLQQVILNLVTNATDAMRSVTDRELQIESKPFNSSGVQITVKDSGSGIAPENVDRIFDTFFTTKATGMGMGLSICRSIVEAHGGQLTAAAAHPHGSAFQVILPGRSDDSR